MNLLESTQQICWKAPSKSAGKHPVNLLESCFSAWRYSSGKFQSTENNEDPIDGLCEMKFEPPYAGGYGVQEGDNVGDKSGYACHYDAIHE